MDTLLSPYTQDSLDIESIKENLKQYFIDNSIISDINYDGSNISVMNQIIAYSTQSINSTIALNANQTNLFLSDIRQNVIFEALKLGYKISRPTSSKMVVQFSSAVNLTIPQWTEFTAGDYTFLNTEDINLLASVPQNITLTEGVFIDSSTDNTLNITPATILKEVILPFKNIENDNLFIKVDKGSGYINYNEVTTRFDIDLNDNTYYATVEPETEYAKIIFSYLRNDNKIQTTDILDISFVLSNGADANGLVDISLDGYDVDLTVVTPSSGGTDIETIESIRENAPLFYNTGNRTVNEMDYKSFLVQHSIIKNANAWGGEKAYPKKLGYTYLTCIPESNRYISTLEEATLINFLHTPRIIGTGKIFKRPNYLPIDISIKILGNVLNIDEKKTEILSNINEYFDSINDFETFFYESKVVRIIENVFSDDIKSSVEVSVTPKIRIDEDLFQNSTVDIFIPNSNKKYYLEKDSVRIDIPLSITDIETYIINGWVKVIDYEMDLVIDFAGTINSKEITLASTATGTIEIDEITYDTFDISLDVDVIGFFIKDLNILRLNDITSDLVDDDNFIEIVYDDKISVISEKSSIFELGEITYV